MSVRFFSSMVQEILQAGDNPKLSLKERLKRLNENATSLVAVINRIREQIKAKITNSG